MTRARLTTNRELEYDVVNLTDNGEYVLRDEFGDVRIFEESSHREVVEVRCDFCGRWSNDAGPVIAGTRTSWMCFGGTGSCP